MNNQEKIRLLEDELKNVKGTKCEVYSRVVGYHRPVDNWNESKQEEFRDRETYNVSFAGSRL